MEEFSRRRPSWDSTVTNFCIGAENPNSDFKESFKTQSAVLSNVQCFWLPCQQSLSRFTLRDHDDRSMCSCIN